MKSCHSQFDSGQPGLEKTALRSRFLELRASVEGASRQTADEAIRRHTLSLLHSIWPHPSQILRTQAGFLPTRSIVGLYRAFRGEVDVFPLLADVGAAGWEAACPVTHRKEGVLTYHLVNSASQWRTGTYGIVEPDETNPMVSMNEVGVLLIPGVAFTPDGRRLGYGGGYYDKLFADSGVTATRIGVAYDCQMATDLPHEPHDARMDWIVTPKGAIRCPRTP